MMRPKSLVLLALALGCGLVASIGISQVLDSNRPTAVATTPIYVALNNINVGDPLTEAMVSLEEWPKDKVPVGAIAKWEDLESRRPRSNIYQGEPILDGKLLAKGQVNDPIQAVPQGMRLKTVSCGDASKSAAGLLSPGDRVDVQLFVQRNDAYGITAPMTRIFLQNIRVFAVDQTIEKSADGADARSVAKTVSLVVTPAQANKITLAEKLGEVSLIPRHPDDESVVDDSEQDAEDLLNPSSANSRKKEQMARNDDEDKSPIASLKALMEQAMAQTAAMAAEAPQVAVKPFEMQIVFPTEITRIQFDSTGAPVNPDDATEAQAAIETHPLAPPVDGPAPEAEEPTLDGFPIDFQQK